MPIANAIAMILIIIHFILRDTIRFLHVCLHRFHSLLTAFSRGLHNNNESSAKTTYLSSHIFAYTLLTESLTLYACAINRSINQSSRSIIYTQSA